MNIPSLCIIQARLKSTRLENKMLLKLGKETLIARAWRLAVETFQDCAVVAIPKSNEDGPLGDELRRVGARIFAWDGPENDVLGRFHACAHRYLWHPQSVIVRWTPDDPWKDPATCRLVAAGVRLPVEQGAEAFILDMLDAAWERLRLIPDSPLREHITDALFPSRVPAPDDGKCWTVDTPEDYEAAKERYAREG